MGNWSFWILVLKELLMGSWKLVYRKPTHTDKYLSINSHHPRSHKKSVVTTLFQRAENLTSDNDDERQYVTNVLKEHNYPKSFLYDCLGRLTLNDCNYPEGDSAVKGFAIVPYIQGIAEPIRKVLNNCGIRVALKLFRTLKHFCETQGSRSDRSENTCCIHAVIARKYIWVKQNVSFARV